MVNLINFFKRLLPAYIEVRSLYWVERGQEMDGDLELIFHLIDTGQLTVAAFKLEQFNKKWDGIILPHWLCVKRSEACRGEAMLNFLIEPLD